MRQYYQKLLARLISGLIITGTAVLIRWSAHAEDDENKELPKYRPALNFFS